MALTLSLALALTLTLALALPLPLTLALVLALIVTLTLRSCGARVKAPPIALRSTRWYCGTGAAPGWGEGKG